MTAKPKTPATPESRIRAAFEKAAKTGIYAHVATQGPGKFYVAGSTLGTIYTVRQLDREPGLGTRWECDCPAGAHQIICYHRAAVVLYLGWMDGYDVVERDGDVFLSRKASRGYAGYVPPIETPEAPIDEAPHPADTVDTFELNLPTDGDEPVHHTVRATTFGTTADDEEAALDRWQDSLERAQVARAAYPPAGLPTPEQAAAQMEIDRYAFEDAEPDLTAQHEARLIPAVEAEAQRIFEELEAQRSAPAIPADETGDDGETPWSDGGRGALPFDEPRDDQSDEYEADDEPARGDGYCPHGLYIQRSTDCDLCWAAEHPEQIEEPDVDDTVNPEDVEPTDARTIDFDDPFIASLEAEEAARRQAAKDRDREPDRWPTAGTPFSERVRVDLRPARRTVLDSELHAQPQQPRRVRPATAGYDALGRRLAYGDLLA